MIVNFFSIGNNCPHGDLNLVLTKHWYPLSTWAEVQVYNDWEIDMVEFFFKLITGVVDLLIYEGYSASAKL